MVVKEYYMTRKDGTILMNSRSTLGLPIRQIDTGIVYDEAIDPETTNRVYEEMDQETDNNIAK